MKSMSDFLKASLFLAAVVNVAGLVGSAIFIYNNFADSDMILNDGRWFLVGWFYVFVWVSLRSFLPTLGGFLSIFCIMYTRRELRRLCLDQRRVRRLLKKGALIVSTNEGKLPSDVVLSLLKTEKESFYKDLQYFQNSLVKFGATHVKG